MIFDFIPPYIKISFGLKKKNPDWSGRSWKLFLFTAPILEPCLCDVHLYWRWRSRCFKNVALLASSFVASSHSPSFVFCLQTEFQVVIKSALNRWEGKQEFLPKHQVERFTKSSGHPQTRGTNSSDQLTFHWRKSISPVIQKNSP